MHDAALSGGASVTFFVENTAVTTGDVVVAHYAGGSADGTSYRVAVLEPEPGGFGLLLENVTGGSRSEPVVISFAVIKAVTS
jgi:hypothetical protein